MEGNQRVLLVVISLGERPWFCYVKKWIVDYCSRCNYDYKVIQEPLPGLKKEDFALFRNFGCANKLAISDLFEGYDRIILVDDTCMLSPRLEPLHKLVPRESIGCWIEGRRKDKSPTDYLKSHKKLYGLKKMLPREKFYNSGVMVMSYEHKVIYQDVIKDMPLIIKDERFNDQGYLSLTAYKKAISLHDLGENYNFVGSKIRTKLKTDRDFSNVRIAHLTGVFSAAQRLDLAKAFDKYFESFS